MNVNSNSEHEFVKRLTKIVETNLQNEQFGVSELAGKMGMSRSLLHRKITKTVGKSASDFLTEKRLEKAIWLLKNSEFTSAEIAYKVGFNSQAYFNKSFQELFGCSPSEYKKTQKPN